MIRSGRYMMIGLGMTELEKYMEKYAYMRALWKFGVIDNDAYVAMYDDWVVI